MSPTVVTESFHNPGGVKTGAIVRRIEPTSLATLTCFVLPDSALHHVECRIEFDDADPRHWTHYVFHDQGSFVEREHEASDPEATVPSHAEYLLVNELLASGARELAFHRLDESTGEILPALLRHDDDHVVLVVDGRPRSIHRVLGDEVLASDWQGATSQHVEDTADLVAGLDDRVAIRVRNFLLA